MEPIRIHLFSFSIAKNRSWVKKQAYELASRAEVVVKGVYEVVDREKRTKVTAFRKRTVEYTVVTGYSYYVEVIGPGLNIERFEQMVIGFGVGYNSHQIGGY